MVYDWQRVYHPRVISVETFSSRIPAQVAALCPEVRNLNDTM
jgi:hypothetical protein